MDAWPCLPGSVDVIALGDLGLIIAVIAVWWVLQTLVLPRLGVPT